MSKCGACGDENTREISLGEAAKKRIHKPCKKSWNAAAERNGFKLNIDAAISFFKPPIAVEPPQKPAISADRLFALIRSARIFDFHYPLRIGPAVAAALAESKIRHFKFCIVNDGDDRLLIHLNKNVETLSVGAQQLRAPDVAPVDVRISLVVLQHPESFMHRNAGNEAHRYPVVEKSAGHVDAYLSIVGL